MRGERERERERGGFGEPAAKGKRGSRPIIDPEEVMGHGGGGEGERSGGEEREGGHLLVMHVSSFFWGGWGKERSGIRTRKMLRKMWETEVKF